VFALVDVNNMYCSVERAFDPRLEGRPLVVLSSNDGACIARSNEAKDLGIKMAQPWFQVRHLQKSRGLVALSANFELYSDMSARMMAIASRYSPNVVPYSIDEAFIDFDGIPGDLTALSRDLRATVLRELGLPTSVGLAPTMTLAKLANHIAKTCDRKPDVYPELAARLAQVCHWGELTEAERETLMARTDVGDVWGVGRKIAALLQAGGIRTVLDLAHSDTASLRRQFSVVFEKTVVELRGTPCMGVEEAPAAKQQILVSRSFGKAVTDAEGIVEAVSEFASRAAEKLREQGSVAGAIQVFFTTSPFREHERQHSPSTVVPLRPTADSRHLVSAAATAARSIFRPEFNYAKAGVMLMDLQSLEEVTQQPELDLFSEPAPEAGTATKDRSALMSAMDALNQRFGRGAVRIGSATTAKANDSGKASWSVRQERRTPRYTTRWTEMPVVKC